jgi:hypothetical protein
MGIGRRFVTTKGSVFVIAALLCAGQAWAQQSIVGGSRARITDRQVVGGSTFGEVMRIVGSPTVSSGTGTQNPAVIDADGDVLEDSNTTVSTAGAWTFGAAGQFSSTLGVTGATTLSSTLTVLGVTTLSSTAPTFRLYDSNAAVSEKYTILEADGGLLSLKLYDDTPSSSNVVFQVDRDALDPADWRWGALLNTIRCETNGGCSLGSQTKPYLTAYIWDLNVETLTAKERIATIGGEVIIAPTTQLTRDVAAADGFIFVKHNQPRTNDTVFLKSFGSAEKMLITGNYIDCNVSGNCVVAGQDFAYPVTRNRSGTGAKNWQAGAAVVNEGNVGDGMIFQYADRSSSVSDSYVGMVVSAGPVAYWRMNATTSTTTADIMGNVGVATETGTQSAGLGVGALAVGTTGADPAWQNTGGAGSLTVADDADLKITADLTIEFIAYWEHTVSRLEHILSRVFNGEYYVDVDAAGVLRFCHGNGTTSECEVTTSAVMPVGSWNHFAIVRDSQSSPKRILVYVNGALHTTETYTQAVATSTNALLIGDTSGGTTQFDGYIDEVAIYNYQVTADVLALHSAARANDNISKFTIGPTECGVVRTGTGAFDLAERWCIGNNAGTYGYNSTTPVYGLVAGSYAADWISIDATNGYRNMYQDTVKLQAVGGNLSLTGDLSIGTAGSLRSGATAYDTATGYWLDYNGGTPRFRIGTTSSGDAYLRFTGTELELRTDTITMNDAGIKIEGNATGSWVNSSAYSFDYNDSSQTGMASIQGSSRDIYLASRRPGSLARVVIIAEDTSAGGVDPSITLTTVNGATPARININTADLFINGIQGFSGTKVAGSCTFTIEDGIVTDVTGC